MSTYQKTIEEQVSDAVITMRDNRDHITYEKIQSYFANFENPIKLSPKKIGEILVQEGYRSIKTSNTSSIKIKTFFTLDDVYLFLLADKKYIRSDIQTVKLEDNQKKILNEYEKIFINFSIRSSKIYKCSAENYDAYEFESDDKFQFYLLKITVHDPGFLIKLKEKIESIEKSKKLDIIVIEYSDNKIIIQSDYREDLDTLDNLLSGIRKKLWYVPSENGSSLCLIDFDLTFYSESFLVEKYGYYSIRHRFLQYLKKEYGVASIEKNNNKDDNVNNKKP